MYVDNKQIRVRLRSDVEIPPPPRDSIEIRFDGVLTENIFFPLGVSPSPFLYYIADSFNCRASDGNIFLLSFFHGHGCVHHMTNGLSFTQIF